MNRKAFCLVSFFVLSMLVLNLGYVQAQTSSRIARFDPNGAPGACNNGLAIDCIDSSMSQASDGTIVTDGSMQIGALFDPAFTLRPTDGTPNAGYIRFGDNTGWQLNIGRNREFSGGPPNMGLTGVLMTIHDNGNVRIGPSVPIETRLTVNSGFSADLGLLVYGRSGTTGKLRIDTDIPDDVPTYSFDVGSHIGNGRGISSGWDTFSSRRWKTNIQTIQGALEKVERLRGVSFDWKEKGGHNIGLIAEEVREVIPEVVSYDENGKDAMGLDYARLTALLIEAAKEQQSQIRELKAEIKGLKALERRTVVLKEKDAEIADLKARLEALEGMVRNAAYQTAWSRRTE